MKITPDLIPDVVEFSIPKFSQYNPRRDVKSSSWFRLDHNWALDVTKKGIRWSLAGFWPVFLGVQAESKSEKSRIEIRWLARTLGVKIITIKKAFAAFANERMIVLHIESVTRTCSTNVTNERNERDVLITNGVPEPERSEKAADAAPRPKGPSPSQLVEIWNQNRGSLPEVTKLAKSRQAKAKVRLNEEPDLGYWERVVKTIAETPFLRGENDRGWKADFDWLIANDANHVKVSEGKYTTKAEDAKPTQSLSSLYRMAGEDRP